MTVDFRTFEEMEFPPYENMVYVFFYIHDEGTKPQPFYVGQSSRHVGRIGDYVSAKFSASTDFKVGEAVKYLRKKGLRVVIKFKESHNKVDEEKSILQKLRGTCRLLNDLKGYHYKNSDEGFERQKIQQFIDQIFENPYSIERIGHALKRRSREATGTSRIRSSGEALVETMTSVVKGTIHGLGKRYADGTEPMEIWVPADRANGLPYSNGNRIPIYIQINGEHYHAGLRATVNNAYVWVSPDVKSKDGVSVKLAHVLTNAGFKKNDKVFLVVDGKNIVLRAANS